MSRIQSYIDFINNIIQLQFNDNIKTKQKLHSRRIKSCEDQQALSYVTVVLK